MKVFAVYTDKLNRTIIETREFEFSDFCELTGIKTKVNNKRPAGSENIFLCRKIDLNGCPVPSSVFDYCSCTSWCFNVRKFNKYLERLVNPINV